MSDPYLDKDSGESMLPAAKTTSSELQKQQDGLSMVTQADRSKPEASGFLSNFRIEVARNGVLREAYVKKLKVAVESDLQLYQSQCESLVSVSGSLNQAACAEMLLRARKLLDNLWNNLTVQASGQYHQAYNDALAQYTQALENTPRPEDTDDPEIQKARTEVRLRQTGVFRRLIDGIMARLDNFHRDWQKPEEARQIVSLSDIPEKAKRV